MNEITFKARLSHSCMDPIAVDGEYTITVRPEEGFLALDSITIEGRDITNDLDPLQRYQVDLAILDYERLLRAEAVYL